MEIFFSFIVFIFGLTIGSFLNCVIHRLEKNQSFLKGRSYCPGCKTNLKWQDLMPVFSFIFLKGKCRYCKEKISWQYPLVEILTGLLFLLIFNKFFVFNFLILSYYWIIVSLLIIVFVYDLKHYIIPNRTIYPLIVITLIYQLFNNLNDINIFFNYILTGFIAALPFFLIVWISRETWMGGGDVKLAFFMGLLLGFPNILVALFISFILGGIIGIGLIVLKKKGLKSEVPFGPFLVTGTFIALFYGQEIINWYLGVLLR